MVGTIIVPSDGCYAGSSGSKQKIVFYDGSDVIIQVEENVPGNNFHKTAIIENLVIYGGYTNNNHVRPGSVGILLKNVYNCIIRNVTILNCEVGIKIENTENYWSQSNRIEHVKIENVKKGILFTAAAGNSGNFGFTSIKDVGIVLASLPHDEGDTSERVGIQIGGLDEPIVKPYSSFIKATVWIGDYTNGCGMKIYGELKYSLVMLTVEADEGIIGTKIGVDIQNSALKAIYDNQSFMLTYAPVVTPVMPVSSLIHDIEVEPL